MRSYFKGEYYDSSFLLSALAMWGLSALLLLIVATVALNEIGCSERSLGYVSSSISFIAAAAAGVEAGRKSNGGLIYNSLLTASVLVTALLTIGFLINGTNIEPSAVMSVVSFSFAGCLVGAVIVSPGKRSRQFRRRI